MECEDELNTWTVVDRLKINSKLQEIASCRFCGTDELRVEEKSRCGLGAEWSFKCRNSECSSHHISRSFHTTPKENRVYGINKGLVLALRLIGRRHSAAERLMSVLNLPSPVGRSPWSSHTKTLLKAANELLDTELPNAALEVKRFKIANGSLAVGGAEKSDQELRELMVEAGASIDGSWCSRGWSARDGVVAAVSIDTGKVLDVVYLTNSCTSCDQKERELKKGTTSRRQYLEWYLAHEENCFMNHEGSAQVSFHFYCYFCFRVVVAPSSLFLCSLLSYPYSVLYCSQWKQREHAAFMSAHFASMECDTSHLSGTVIAKVMLVLRSLNRMGQVCLSLRKIALAM